MKFFPVSVQTDSRPVKRWSLSRDETGRCGLTKREMALNMKARLSGDLTSRGRENKFNDSGGVIAGTWGVRTYLRSRPARCRLF